MKLPGANTEIGLYLAPTGPTGDMMGALGLPSNQPGCAGCVEHIVNLTLNNINLKGDNILAFTAFN